MATAVAASVAAASTNADLPTCYICYEASSQAQPFIEPSPCSCSGSIHLHYSCFQKIQEHNPAPNCSICKRPYKEITTIEDYEEIVEEGGIHYRVTGTRSRITGAKDGLIVYYYPDGGHKRCVEYVEDKQHGMFEEYFESGILAVKTTYRTGHRHGKCLEFHSGGTTRIESNYHHGTLHGEYTEYYENGKTKSAISYYEGLRESLACEYYENGIQGQLVEYVNGEKNGTEYQHYISGGLKANLLWENGKMVTAMEFHDLPGAPKKADYSYNNAGELIFEKHTRPDGIVYKLLADGEKPGATMLYLYTMNDKGVKLEH